MPKNPPPKPHERRKGQGSISETAPGVWRAWRPPDANGRRLSRRFSNREQAHRWLVGEPEPAVLYVGPWCERWLGLRAPTLRGRTPQTYEQFVGYIEEGAAPISATPLADLSTDDCQAWLNGLLPSYSRATVKVSRGIVSSALKAAVRRGLIAANPIQGTRLPSAGERPPRAWTRDELARILAAAEGTAHAAWFSFAIGTGLRLGELRALLWTDLDLHAMTARVSKSMDYNTGRVGPTKTGRTRTVDVPDELHDALVAHRLRQRASDLLVWGHDGRAYHPTAYRQWLHRVCTRASAPAYSCHSTRHTAASLLLSDGVEPMEVAHLLGHASLAVTLGTYAHYIPRVKRRTATALGAILGGAQSNLHRNAVQIS